MYITVRPVNDEPPRFELTFYSFAVNRISASGVDIGQVEATDDDQDVGGEITYSILNGDITNFGVKQDGMVYLKDYIFVSEGNSFYLEVIASDGQFNSTTDVFISVSGVLSVPEIVITATAVAVLIVVVICSICCFWYNISR